MYVDELAFLLTGILIGAGLVRYGIGLGIKLFYQFKTDKLFDKFDKPIEQEFTSDEDEEEELA